MSGSLRLRSIHCRHGSLDMSGSLWQCGSLRLSETLRLATIRKRDINRGRAKLRLPLESANEIRSRGNAGDPGPPV